MAEPFSVPRRPSRIAELADRAALNLWDPSRGIRHWLRAAENFRKAGRAYYDAGDLEAAFVEFAKAATIISEKLPSHKEYFSLLTSTQRHNLGLNGQDILVHLGDIKPILVERYERWAAQHPEEASAVDAALHAGVNTLVDSGADQHPLERAFDFRSGSSRKLEHLGDTTVGVQRDGEAISRYMNAMSLDPSPRDYPIEGNEVCVDTRPLQQVVADESQREDWNTVANATTGFSSEGLAPQSSSSRRPPRVTELADRIEHNLWDPSMGIKHWLRAAEKFRKAGRAYHEAGDLEAAFVESAKAATIILEKLPSHKEYFSLLTSTQRHNLGLNGQDILVHLGDIKLILVDRYERWAAQHPEEAAAVDAGLNVRVESRADQYPDYHESSWRGYEAVGPHNVVEQKTSAYHDRPQMGPASSTTKENPERPPNPNPLQKLEHLGDAAVIAQRHDEAILHYTNALSLNPPSPQRILIKRSKAYVATTSWNQALDDANMAIALDPSSPWGYEIKHAVLHKAGDYDNAINALEEMHSKIEESPDPNVQQYGDRYITPSSTRATIRGIVQRTIRRMPRVLLNTASGRLRSKAEQASAFEYLPVFNELVSSTTTRIDYVRIKREVRLYFRYVTLSHRWEDNEPLFQQVIHKVVYELDSSPTHDKLKTFCQIVRDAGISWAWSDTCCVDKSDHFVLQEALVAMFKWYQGSTMMIVFLRGARPSRRGALVKSIWNTRAWTLQEYVAASVIRFYTEDWTLYLDLELPNHKVSPEIISEMEQATGVSAQQLMSLRPGLNNIREKLRLASTRQTTLVEDAAYSLLGIFSVSGIPAIYGEGESSLGRLLAHVLAGSGDVSILAWTGESGGFNSCLPAHITVFKGPATSHLPRPVPDVEMRRIITSRSSSFDLEAALALYDRLNELSAPWFAASRMKLPCIIFQLPTLSPYRTRSGYVFRADTVEFGVVEIKTRQDLSRMKSFYLVHPWLDALLEREDIQNDAFLEDEILQPPSPDMGDEELVDEEMDVRSIRSSLFPKPLSPLPAHVQTAPVDRETGARRLVARLRQPFGALLLKLVSTGRRYSRVAADDLITVRIQDNVSLSNILDNVQTIDVL